MSGPSVFRSYPRLPVCTFMHNNTPITYVELCVHSRYILQCCCTCISSKHYIYIESADNFEGGGGPVSGIELFAKYFLIFLDESLLILPTPTFSTARRCPRQRQQPLHHPSTAHQTHCQTHFPPPGTPTLPPRQPLMRPWPR